MHSLLQNAHLPLASARTGPPVRRPALAVSALPVSQCRNPRVLPRPVRQASVTFDPLDVREAGVDWSAFAAMPDLTDATPPRRFEFLAGRLCVAAAMQDLFGSGVMIGRRPDGTPLWPAGLTGSITHTIGFVSAAVAFTRCASAIGIDSEEILSAERATRVASVFATAAEVAAARSAALDEQTAITLIFSAKEAIFKCLHASVRRVFDFHDVRITEVDAGARRFTAHVVEALCPSFPAGATLSGGFDVDSRRVHTGMFIAPRVRE